MLAEQMNMFEGDKAKALRELSLRRVYRWMVRKARAAVHECWAAAGGFDIRPAHLPGIVSRFSISVEDAARWVLSTVSDLSGLNEETLEKARQEHPSEIEMLLDEADSLAERRFRLLGVEVDFSSGIDWHLDFKNNYRFDSSAFWARIPILSPGGGFDIKYPLELSRLQHLPRLALAYRFSGRAKYLQAIESQLRDWLERNPTGFGPNWTCAMDVSIRAANIALALAFAGEHRWPADFAIDVVRSLIAHGRFVLANLEWSEDFTNNHYLADIAGLAVLASLLGASVHEAAGWRRFARDQLEVEMMKQVYADGSGFEASTAYHRLSFECFSVATVFLQRMGELFSSTYLERLALMRRFLSDMSLPDGSFPLIGDNDDGRMVVFLPPDVLPSPVFPYPLCPVPEQLSVDGIAAYPCGGFWFLRSQGGADLVTFRLGPVGQNGRGGHAHNDQLSITVSFSGKPVIVDPGISCYCSDPRKRNLFRSTASHATICLDGEEQNRFEKDPFTLRQQITLEPALARHEDGIMAVEGGFRGYGGRPESEVMMRRKVEFDTARRVVQIFDTVELRGSASGKPCLWHFPLAPALNCRIGHSALTLHDETGSPVAEIVFTPGWNVEAVPTAFSPAYGVEIPNLTVRCVPPHEIGQAQFVIRALK